MCGSLDGGTRLLSVPCISGLEQDQLGVRHAKPALAAGAAEGIGADGDSPLWRHPLQLPKVS
jgi:hypothetical protein